MSNKIIIKLKDGDQKFFQSGKDTLEIKDGVFIITTNFGNVFYFPFEQVKEVVTE